MTTLNYVNTDSGEVNIELFNKTKAGLTELKKQYGTVPAEITADNYDWLKEACKTLTKTRTAIEEKRKEIKQPYLDAGRMIDGEAKKIMENIQSLEEPLKAAKKKYDEKEKRAKEERIAKLQEKLDRLLVKPVSEARGKTAEQIEDIIEKVHSVDATQDFYDLTEQAVKARDNSLTELQRLHSERVDFEFNEKKRKEAEEQLAEQQRKQNIESRLTKLRGIPMEMFNASYFEINTKIESVKNHKPEEHEFGERTEEAVSAWKQVLQQLEQLLPMAKQREQEKAKEQTQGTEGLEVEPATESPNKESGNNKSVEAHKKVYRTRQKTDEEKAINSLWEHCGIGEEQAESVIEAVKRGVVHNISWNV